MSLTLSNITVSYNNTLAVERVSFSVEEGSISVLLGPNGSGKSTILKAILGIVPYTGHIHFSGVLENQPLSFGYVPQRFAFDFSIPLTVEEFLHLALLSCTHPPKEKKNMIHEALSSVHVQDLHTKPLKKLSGGQLQRVLLARALVHRPQLLVLDEPESGIDVTTERVFYTVLENLIHKRKDVTILIASHELELVRQYADTVICVNKKVLCSGKPDQVLTQKTFDSLYAPHGVQYYDHRCHA